MPKFPKKMSLVVVEWVDATVLHASWVPYEDWDAKLAENPDGLLCTTVGYLLRVDTGRIVLAMSYNTHGHLADGISIPTGCIRSMGTLAPPPKIFASR